MGAQPWDDFVPMRKTSRSPSTNFVRANSVRGVIAEVRSTRQLSQKAFENMDASGTAAILDMTRVSDEPAFFAVAPLPAGELRRLFGTDQPTREMIKRNRDFYEDIDRGQGTAARRA
jgi:hypothetical protein